MQNLGRLLFLWLVGSLCGLNAVGADWIASAKSGNLAYFLFGQPGKLERYSLGTGQWLSPIHFAATNGPATAFAVDGDSIYVAFGSVANRYSLTGGNEVRLLSASSSVSGILIDEDFVFFNHSVSARTRLTSVRKSDQSIVHQIDWAGKGLGGASIAPSINRIFGRSVGVTPSDIVFVDYDEGGNFTQAGDSPYNGTYTNAVRTWVFPDDSKVVDDSGNIYDPSDLAHLGNIYGPVTDVDFYGSDIPIVVMGRFYILAYSKAMVPTGSALTPNGLNAYVAGTNVVGFSPFEGAPNGILAETISLSYLNAATPGEPIDPTGLAYSPDDMFLDRNGVLFLVSRRHRSLFRWDSVSQSYLRTIELKASPSYVTYSATNHVAYLAYTNGSVTQIDLASTNLVEASFTTLAAAPIGLATADSYVFAVTSEAGTTVHRTYSPGGSMVLTANGRNWSKEYTWSSARQKMFYLRDDAGPVDLLSEEINASGGMYPGEDPGWIGAQADSPLEAATGFAHPVRVSPDGSVVVLGSGVLHDGTSLARLTNQLVHAISDAAWVDGELRTIHDTPGGAQLVVWVVPGFYGTTSRTIPGEALGLMEMGPNRMLAVTIQDGVPAFYVMSSYLGIINASVLQPPPVVSAAIVSPLRVDLQWIDVTGEETYSVQRKTGANGAWAEIGTTSTGMTNFSDMTVMVGSEYVYRVFSKNGPQVSAPSWEVAVSFRPPSIPQNLVATSLSSSSIKLTWDDSRDETGYSIFRSLSGTGPWSTVAQIPADSTVFTNAGLASGTRYFYAVEPKNLLGAISSEVVDAMTDFVPPPEPWFASAEALSSTTVELRWFDVTLETGYRVERRAGAAGEWAVIAATGSNSVVFLDTTANPSTDYDYRLFATNEWGASEASVVRTAQTPPAVPPPSPTGIRAVGLSESSIAVSWSDVAFEVGYRVQMRIQDETVWMDVATNAANSLSFTNGGLSTGARYWFRVVAFNAHGASSPSVEDDAVPSSDIVVLEDDFDPTIDAGKWTSVTGGGVTNRTVGFLEGNALFFGSSSSRVATTVPVSIREIGAIEFDFRAGNSAGDGPFWENSDSGETVRVEYSKNNSSTWSILTNLNSVFPAFSNWNHVVVSIPAEAAGPSVRFRWRQLAHSGSGNDVWAIDNVAIRTRPPEPPDRVPFLLTSATSSTSIGLFWIAVTNVENYRIERREGGSPWTMAATTSPDQTYFTDSGLIPNTVYSYRIVATNSGGDAVQSPVSISFTLGQLQQWTFDNLGTFQALSASELVQPEPDGSLPLLRYAFNLTKDGPERTWQPGDDGGYPAIWLDATGRLCVEFVRRKASSNPEVIYRVEFTSDLANWTVDPTPVAVVPIDTIWERVRYEDGVKSDGTNIRFGRVSVEP